MPSSVPLDPNVEYRLERGALRLVETLFRPGDVICVAWKVHAGAGHVRMHHQFRQFEQLVAQHRAGGGLFRQLVALNTPRATAQSSGSGPQLFDGRCGSDVYFCVNPLHELVDPETGEPAFHRRRSHVAAVRTIGMDMDHGGPAGIARLADDVADGLLPPPHLVVQTSHGLVGQGDRRRYHQKCHLLWAAADAADVPGGFTVDDAEQLIQRLAPRYGADPTVRSGEHLLRVPGFFNCKPPSDRVDAIDLGPFGSEGRAVHVLDGAETGLYEPVERALLSDFAPVLERPFEPLDPLPSQRVAPVAVLAPPPDPDPAPDPDPQPDSSASKKKKRAPRLKGGSAILDPAERARYLERIARDERAYDREHGPLELDYVVPGADEVSVALRAAARGPAASPPPGPSADVARAALRGAAPPAPIELPLPTRTRLPVIGRYAPALVVDPAAPRVDRSASGHDFGVACQLLAAWDRAGRVPAERPGSIAAALAVHRGRPGSGRIKSDPHGYAVRTVRAACRKLGLPEPRLRARLPAVSRDLLEAFGSAGARHHALASRHLASTRLSTPSIDPGPIVVPSPITVPS